MTKTAESVRNIVRSVCGPDAQLDDATPLFQSGLNLDSLSFLQLIMALEKEFGLRLRDENLTDEVLLNLKSLILHIDGIVGAHET